VLVPHLASGALNSYARFASTKGGIDAAREAAAANGGGGGVHGGGGGGGGGEACAFEAPSPRRLIAHLRGRIHDVGPMTVADYMREALTNPVGGYYMQGGVWACSLSTPS
jgi:hypothetical protein